MKKSSLKRIALKRIILASLAAIIGLGVMSASPALADRKKDHWKHDRHGSGHGHPHGHYVDDRRYYYDEPRVVYVQPRTIYVEEPAYYVVPAPRHAPRPVVYERPSINIVVPLFD